jgi:hypothetical protein
VAEQLEATRARIRVLESLSQLKAEEAALLKKLGLNQAERPAKRKQRDRSTSSSEGSHHETRVKPIKPRNITQFAAEHVTLRKRKEWLQDLERVFAGDPKRYNTDSNKILFALDNMAEKHRTRWYSHVRNMTDDDRKEAETHWSAFENWTRECVDNLADQTSQAFKDLNGAKQRDTQTPLEFHQYLESIEDEFERKSDQERALVFYSKLNRELIRHIDHTVSEKPKTREGMVRCAMQYWPGIQRQLHKTPPNRDRGGGDKSYRHSNQNRHKPYHRDDKKTPQEHDDKGGSHERKHDDKREPPRCWTCNSDKHLQWDCPKAASPVNEAKRGDRGGYRRKGSGYRSNPRGKDQSSQ